MAEQKHGSSQGSMDITDHMRAWKGFVRLIKWSTIGILLVMGFMAIFRVN